MCRMTETGMRGADAIDKEGLWYVSDRRIYGGPIYLLDRTEANDMSAFWAKWILKADGGAGE